jgi:UDP-N-acetylmuramyl pentapeptide phosphotransferase/UDP-N-acetylglucosamine-1-phosphate transferase
MAASFISFLFSCVFTVFLIRYRFIHGHLSNDSDFDGPQKFHTEAVPRIGGLSIITGIAASVILLILTKPNFEIPLILLLCSIPTFCIGLLEDFTKSISPKIRLFFTSISALLVIYFLECSITKVDVIGVDELFLISGFGIFFTAFAIIGITNAYNIIDGFHGLSSMVATIGLLAICYLALSLNDRLIAQICFLMIGANLGFFIWNYPRGLIFLGDGGAYLLGFWTATTSILLIVRHPEISPWVAIMINGYPILETLFSIWRKAIHRKGSASEPDSIHFHMLIYRRILSPNQTQSGDKSSFSLNAKTSPYLWALSGCSAVPAILWPHSTKLLMFFAALVCILYIWLYLRIVRFQTPRWLHMF